MAGAGGSGTGASIASFEPQPETVEALLSATVRVIEDERARGEAADTKAGQLVGFTGVILAVEASLGSGVFDHGISGGYSYAFVTLFAVSLLAWQELVSEEESNNRKLDVVSRAGLLLMIRVVALAGEGGTLAVEHLAMSTPR